MLRNKPGNHKHNPLSIISFVFGCLSFRKYANLGFIVSFSGKLEILWKTILDSGPETRITATPHLPWPDCRDVRHVFHSQLLG